MTHRVLVVDDDIRLQKLLYRYLTQHGFKTSVASNAQEMYRLIRRNVYQLYILDINLPGDSGLIICQRLRATGNKTPVLMLTARGDSVDLILGLDLGADDYLTKPFNPRELLARIKSVLRRYAITYGAYTAEDFQCSFGKYILDTKLGQLTHSGEPVPLNEHEFVLLQSLVQNAGQPMSRTQLSERLYGCDHIPDQRGIDMIVSRIRKKLQKCSDNIDYIQTVRSVGYMFRDENSNKEPVA